jgi:hypothetical protein
MISCVYRFCEEGNVSNPTYTTYRPTWFSKKKCLQSFLNAVDYAGSTVKEVIFVHDGPKGELYEIISEKYSVIKLNRNENYSSSVDTLNFCKDLSENFYLLEDDYLHKPNSIKAIDNVLDKFLFATNYDHPGQYTKEFSHLYDIPRKHLEYFDQQTEINWRTRDFCCYTFAVNKDLFKEKSYFFHKNVCQALSLCIDLYVEGVNLWSSDPGLMMQLDKFAEPFEKEWKEFNEQIQ